MTSSSSMLLLTPEHWMMNQKERNATSKDIFPVSDLWEMTCSDTGYTITYIALQFATQIGTVATPKLTFSAINCYAKLKWAALCYTNFTPNAESDPVHRIELTLTAQALVLQSKNLFPFSNFWNVNIYFTN